MSRIDPHIPPVSRIALLGGGEKAASLLRTVRRLCPTGERLSVVAVCDADVTSPALEAARADNIPHVGRLVANVLAHGDVDVLVDLRNVNEPGFGVDDMIPKNVQVIGLQGVTLLMNMLELTRDSERARAEDRNELQDTRARLDQFMALAPFSIYVKNTKLNYVLMNQTALSLLKLESDDVIGKSDFDLFPSAVARRIQAREQQVLKDLQPATFQGVLPLQGNDRMYFSATIFPIVRNERPIAIFGLLEDITELHRSERRLVDRDDQLTETREELKGILENSQDIIFLMNPDGRLKSYNNSAENVFGPDRDAVLNRVIAPFVSDAGEFMRLFKTVLQEGHASSYELGMARHGSGEIIVNISLTRVNDSRGRPLEIVVICRDITERLKLREDLIQTERLAAIGKMAAGVAHEINNPLAIIETLAGVMEDSLAETDCHDKEALEFLQGSISKLYVQTGRCTSITHNLLGFARRSSGIRRMVDVPALMDQSLDLLRTEAKRINLKVVRHYAKDLPPVHTDPQLLEQIFVNLLKNAMDAIEEHRPEQSVIELSISLLEDPGDASMRMATTITDNGIGIPEENLGQVFDLFYTSKPAGKGTGLGLSIVHNILKKIDGEIRLESEYGKGSGFTVILPLRGK